MRFDTERRHMLQHFTSVDGDEHTSKQHTGTTSEFNKSTFNKYTHF